jgi:riboflavin kinase
LKRIKLSGTVFAGGGEGKEFLEIPWVKSQITEKLGFAPYLGTLNVRLSAENAKRRNLLLEEACAIKVCPAEGYCNGLLIKAFIGALECAIVVPEVAGYPKDVLEIIAAVNLRETLQLEDGTEVTIAVDL